MLILLEYRTNNILCSHIATYSNCTSLLVYEEPPERHNAQLIVEWSKLEYSFHILLGFDVIGILFEVVARESNCILKVLASQTIMIKTSVRFQYENNINIAASCTQTVSECSCSV